MIHLRRIAVAVVGGLLPFVWDPSRLAHPSPWISLAAALVLQLTLPIASARDMSLAQSDGGSAKWILIVGNLTALVAIFEFALRPKMAPPPFSWWVFVGGLLLGIGTALRVWAIRVLGNAFTGVVQTTADQPLIDRGPYRIIRHPSYAAMLVVFFGEVFLMRSIGALVLTLVAVIPVYLFRIRLEERALEAHFGARYAEYRSRSWALVPYVF